MVVKSTPPGRRSRWSGRPDRCASSSSTAAISAAYEVLAKADVPGRDDVGALRLRTVAAKDHPCADFPLKSGNEDDPAVLLDLDYWVLMPR